MGRIKTHYIWPQVRDVVASNSNSLCDRFADFMMASALLNFDPFDMHADGAIAQRWRKWIKRLENLFVAAAIADKKRQRALLLYYAGEEVCEIFETLVDTGDDFATAKEKLTEYFDPKKNVEYEIYTFRQARQNPGESMNAFHSRLRQLSATCEFDDINKEIKSQIILSCSSQRLRRKALRDTTMTLETLLNEARALEISETQAKVIESSGNAANAVLPTPSQPKKNCFNCGGIWPHDSKTGCPARNRKCNGCHKYGHYAKCCTQKSRETRNSRKGKQPCGRGNPKERKKQNVNRLEAECEERETLSSSDDEYTFRLEVPASKVSAPFVSLKVNGVVCKFLVNSGASTNIVSSNAVKVFGVDLHPSKRQNSQRILSLRYIFLVF